MRTRSRRALGAVLLTLVTSFVALPASAQDPAPAPPAAAPAPAPAGPRLPPVMRRAEPDYANADRFAPKKKEQFTTITISTLALVLLLVLIIVLIV